MRRENVKRLPLILYLFFLANILAYIPPFKADLAQASPTTNHIFVDPSAVINQSLTAGSTFWINTNISGGEDVYAWQVRLEWNTSVVGLDFATYPVFHDYLTRPRKGPWGVLTQNATAGGDAHGHGFVTVTDGSKFYGAVQDKLNVTIMDDFNSEVNQLNGTRVGNILYLTNPLLNNYTVAANAEVRIHCATLAPNLRVNPVAGYLIAGQTTSGDWIPGENGDGPLVSLKFQVLDSYASTELILNPTYTFITNSFLVDIPATTTDGYFRNWGPGDANGDHIVDIFDIGTISAHWYPGPPIGPLGYGPDADMQTDPSQRGTVDIFDIGIASANWSNYYP